MDTHSCELLEFDSILEELKGYCVSDDGRHLLDAQTFSFDPAQISLIHDRAFHLQALAESGEPMPDVSFPPIAAIVERAAKQGTVLEGEELVAIAAYSRSAGLMSKHASSSPQGVQVNPLLEVSSEIPDLLSVVRTISGFLEPDGSVKESVPEIRAVVQKIRSAQTSLRSSASTYLQGDTAIWQTDVPTVREGRTVLPMKSEYKARVPGVVRDVSPTGATLFIEPYDIVEKNNEVAILEHEYAMEVARIMRQCTATVREHVDDLQGAIKTVAYIDAIHARALYDMRHECVRAEPAARGFSIRGARHPLLGAAAVPIDILLDEETRILIITGPNAGGKTVTLKTVGLFILMNQFGVGIPAREGSSLPIYSQVYADIGDDQSIQESLSTFSGHMKRIASFARDCSESSLLLLDEIGGGTDPEEGSAIAMALLDFLLARRCTTVATTHSSAIKNYGYITGGVMNASVEFDAEAHRPTYRLILGLPGESHALDIASGSGLAEEIVQKARSYLDERRSDVDHIIREMQEKERELGRREQAAERARREIEEKVRETDLLSLRLKQRELELRTQGYAELNRHLQESRSRLENLVRELREGEVTREKTKEVKQFIEELSESSKAEQEKIRRTRREILPDRELAPGVAVFVGSSNREGTIVRKAREGGWVVATGNMKVTVPEEEIKAVRKNTPRSPSVSVEHTAVERPSFQLDVRGYRLAEAIEALDRQIDRALMSGLYEFEIIHGHGEGVLQTGIHAHLRKHRSVTDYHFADPKTGGFGKTIIKLD